MLTEEDKTETWNNWKEHISALERRYSIIPQRIQNALVERDFKDMYGVKGCEFINSAGHWPILLENAIAALSKTVKKNILKREWEWMAFKEFKPTIIKLGTLPNYTETWEDNKEEAIKFFIAREENKEYVKLILC